MKKLILLNLILILALVTFALDKYVLTLMFAMLFIFVIVFYELRAIREAIEASLPSETKEDLPSIREQLSSIQKQLSGEEGGLITAIHYKLGREGDIYKQLTQKLAKKKAEELLVKLDNHEACFETSKAGWVPIGILVRKSWSENKSFRSWVFLGPDKAKSIDDWWEEVNELERNLENVKWDEASKKFKDDCLLRAEKVNGGKIKISYEIITEFESDHIKEVRSWWGGPPLDGVYETIGVTRIEADCSWRFLDLLKYMGCPEEKIPKEDFMAENSGRILNIEW
jgi:hypothetical protein